MLPSWPSEFSPHFFFQGPRPSLRSVPPHGLLFSCTGLVNSAGLPLFLGALAGGLQGVWPFSGVPHGLLAIREEHHEHEQDEES